MLGCVVGLLLTGCGLLLRQHPPIEMGSTRSDAVPYLREWADSGTNRVYDFQDLGRDRGRLYSVFDSLMLSDIYRRAGVQHPDLRRFPPAPLEPNRLCRESYILYLRGDRIVGAEYREIVSNGKGGYRQIDDAVGEIPASLYSST